MTACENEMHASLRDCLRQLKAPRVRRVASNGAEYGGPRGQTDLVYVDLKGEEHFHQVQVDSPLKLDRITR
jgi:hypothetical protein